VTSNSGLDGCQKLMAAHPFQNVASRPCHNRPEHVCRIFVHGDHEDVGGGSHAFELRQHGHAIYVRQLDIQQDDVWLQRLCLSHGVVRCPRFPDYFQIAGC
jgi:hypothetical protein